VNSCIRARLDGVKIVARRSVVALKGNRLNLPKIVDPRGRGMCWNARTGDRDLAFWPTHALDPHGDAQVWADAFDCDRCIRCVPARDRGAPWVVPSKPRTAIGAFKGVIRAFLATGLAVADLTIGLDEPSANEYPARAHAGIRAWLPLRRVAG
jgi:hypothetical protein